MFAKPWLAVLETWVWVSRHLTASFSKCWSWTSQFLCSTGDLL